MRDFIKRHIPVLVSSLTIIVTLVVQFAVFSVNEEFVWSEFLPQLIVNVFLLVTTAMVWLNAGTDRAKREEKSPYKDNAALYSTKIKTVTDGNRLGDLREFCAYKTDKMREEKITVMLANVGIDRKLYDTDLSNLTSKDFKEKGYDRRQRRVMARIQKGRVRVEPVRAMDLLSDSKTPDDCGVSYDEQADKARRISFRALRSVLTAFVLAIIAIDPAQDIANIAAWVLFLMRLFTIVWTAYSSEREGYVRITETKNKVILKRIAFLHEFDEWESVPRLETAKNNNI